MASTLTGISGTGASFGAALSLAAIGTWIGQVSEQMNNTSKIGYKARRTQFTGNHTTSLLPISPAGAYGAARAEDFLSLGPTTLDFSQGTITSSYSPYHAAINGKGVFVLTDDDTALNRLTYYSRDGEFHVDAEGYLRTLEGLYVTSPEYAAGRLGPEQNVWNWTPVGAATPNDWEYREKLKIENKNPFFTMPSQSIVQFEVPLKNMLLEQKVMTNLDDLRVVHIPTGLELPRNVVINGDKASVTFRLNATIPKLGSTDDYYIYYGNDNAPAAPLDTTITPGGVPTLPFQDDFNDGAVSWVTGPSAGENWIEANAGGGASPFANTDTDTEFRQTVNTGFQTTAVTGNPNWNDYRFSVTMGNLDNDNDSVYVYGRVDTANNVAYRFTLRADGTPSRRIDKVNWTTGAVIQNFYGDNTLPHVNCNQAAPIGVGAANCPFWEYRVEMEFVGNAIRLFQDGNLVAEVFDNGTPILGGQIGLGNVSQSAWFDDVDVQPPVQNAELSMLGRDGLVKFDHSKDVAEQIGWTGTFPEHNGLEVTHYGTTIYRETQDSGVPAFGTTTALAGSTTSTINVAAGTGTLFKAGDRVRVTGGRYANTSATGGTATVLNVTPGTGNQFQVGDTVTVTGGVLNNIVHTTTVAARTANTITLAAPMQNALGNNVTPIGGEYIKRVHHGDNYEVVTVNAVAGDVLTVSPLLIAPDPGAFVSLEREDILVPEALEASNATEEALIPELIMAQSMAESLAKIILVADSNIKIAFDLVK